MIIELGVSAESRLVVTEDLSAEAMGSGDMAVLATPAMVALMENAAMKAVCALLDEGSTTVGVAISTSHIKASKIGSEVRAVARVVGVDGRKIEFEITAYDGDSIIGEAKHTRFIVDRAKFLSKLA